MPVYTINLTFPGDGSPTDVTELVRYGSLDEQLTAFDETTKRSTIDTVSFHINENTVVRQKFLAASDRIQCTIDETPDGGGATTRRFTGYVSPMFTTLHYQILDGFTVTAEDNSYKLDVPVGATRSYPTNVGGTQYAVYRTDNVNSIVSEILQSAGYNLATDIASGNPNIDISVQHFAVEKDEATYRDVLDELLYEYRHAFTFDEDGKFKVVPWSHDDLTTVATFDKSNVLASSGLSVDRREILEDGARVKFARLERIDDVRLYYSTSPPNNNPTEFAFNGWPIAPGDYYPPDSDIEDIYQQYREDWLDVPYQTRQTRLRNKDIDLVSSSNQRLIYNSEAGIAIDIEEYEPFRARVRFINNDADIKKLFAFEVLGTALFRNSVLTASYPTTTIRPREYVTKNVFDNVAAQNLAIAIGRDLVFSSFRYSWVSEDAVYPGQLVQMVDPDLDINTTVVINSRSYNDRTGYYSYTGVGVTLFTTDSVLTVGQASANSGIQEQTELLNVPTFADIEGGEIVVASFQYPSTAPAARNCTGDDDEEQINAAITDLVNTFGGGRVKLTRGVYNIDGPIYVRSGISIEGDGASTNLLMRGADAQILIGRDTDGNIIGSDEVQIRNVKVERVQTDQIDGGEPGTVYALDNVDGGAPDTTYALDDVDAGSPGSSFNQSTVELLDARDSVDVWVIDSIFSQSYGNGLLLVNSNNITLRNCQVTENDGFGVVVRGAALDGGAPDTTTFEMTVDGGAPDTTLFVSSEDGGLPSDTYSLNCIISECYISGNVDGLWFVGDDGLVIDNYMTNNTFDGAVISGVDNQFHGNYCNGNGDNGVVISGNSNSAVGTRAKNNGGSGIEITGDLALINGCIVQRNSTGILVGSTADNTVLTGNAASGNGTNFTDNGTGTQTTGNLF